MRQVVLDTETTGLDIKDGNRIIEIGCIEIMQRRITGNTFHTYLNPQRDSEAGALHVHGLDSEFLQDKPLFEDIVDDLMSFLEGAELIIHNAPFDIGFLDHELSLLGDDRRIESVCTVVDTLQLAKQIHPGQANSLDALCRRYQIDNSSRSLHGALLDSELLAEVYLRMTGGQVSLDLNTAASSDAWNHVLPEGRKYAVLQPTSDELRCHMNMRTLISKQGGGAVWDELEQEEAHETENIL
ncbi:MAG: DNA polymerase III subunit epsilon [Gammaproteobacteria bacterium]|nr:MAG: DNA polymerase III subunit epsilon [Gammaproteobacteria bacterium]